MTWRRFDHKVYDTWPPRKGDYWTVNVRREVHRQRWYTPGGWSGGYPWPDITHWQPIVAPEPPQ